MVAGVSSSWIKTESASAAFSVPTESSLRSADQTRSPSCRRSRSKSMGVGRLLLIL